MDKPPLDIEQAIDLILSTPAMFSKHSEGQREFGKLIVEEYYLKLREENKNDPVAYRYLVNLFASISSAVRAFGVQHSIFETSWKTIEDIKQNEIEAAKRITDYSPFRGGHFWEKFQGLMISLFGGGGIGAVVSVFIKTENYRTLIIALVLVGWAVGIIGLDYWLNGRKDTRINEVLKKYPTDVSAKWKADIIPQYKKIIKQFLLSAIKVREEFYPSLPTFDDSKIYQFDMLPHIQFEESKTDKTKLTKKTIDEHIDSIIERHFAF